VGSSLVLQGGEKLIFRWIQSGIDLAPFGGSHGPGCGVERQEACSASQFDGGDNSGVERADRGLPGISRKEMVTFLPQKIPVHRVNVKTPVKIDVQHLP